MVVKRERLLSGFPGEERPVHGPQRPEPLVLPALAAEEEPKAQAGVLIKEGGAALCFLFWRSRT